MFRVQLEGHMQAKRGCGVMVPVKRIVSGYLPFEQASHPPHDHIRFLIGDKGPSLGLPEVKWERASPGVVGVGETNW